MTGSQTHPPQRPADEPCGHCPIQARCCTRGVEVPAAQKALIEGLDIPVAKPWFVQVPLTWNDGTGDYYSTVVTGRGCVFLTSDHKCAIHRYCLERGLEVKTYKPSDCLDYPFVDHKISPDYPMYCGIYFGEGGQAQAEKA